MLKSLKATFGGSQITDSERIFLQSTMPSLMDSPKNIKRKMEANKKLMRHIMERENALSQTSNFNEFQEVRRKYQTEEYKELLSSGGEITRASSANVNDNLDLVAKEKQRRLDEDKRGNPRAQQAFDRKLANEMRSQ